MTEHSLVGSILKKKPLSFDAGVRVNFCHNLVFSYILHIHRLRANKLRVKLFFNYKTNRPSFH